MRDNGGRDRSPWVENAVGGVGQMGAIGDGGSGWSETEPRSRYRRTRSTATITTIWPVQNTSDQRSNAVWVAVSDS